MRALSIGALLVFAFLAPAGVAHAKNAKKAAKKAAASKASPEQVSQEFDQFCQDWMAKLAQREHDNIKNIKWNSGSDGVEGEYVGYPPDHTCVVKDGGEEPVGKIAYQEVRYEKHGATVAEAQQNPAHAVETTAVTELFRYDHGKWIY